MFFNQTFYKDEKCNGMNWYTILLYAMCG